jgi:hypothetical protein
LRKNELFNTLNIFLRHFQGISTADTINNNFLSCLRGLEDGEGTDKQRDPLRAVYEMALRFLEKEAAENGFEKGLLFLQRDLYKELEYILSFGQNDTRHDFLVVIPVADRPMMLKNCLESLVEQFRIFQYGGFTINAQGRPVYHKISAIIIDDSKDEDNRGKMRGICADNVSAGIRTYYVGLEEQTELLRQIPPGYQEHLQALIGESCGPVQSHKGASISRNIAYLYLNAFLGRPGDKTLIYFLDSDEEFKVKIDSGTGIEDIQFINYFYWLDRIFNAGDVEIVTGKVVGDPPVSPAVMINTFLEDITLFIETIASAAPDGKCIFHGDESAGSASAEYHDMVKLFGYNSSPLPKKYHCGLPGDHSIQDCLLDFSKKTLGFFYGLHPTRTQLYLHKGDFTEIENARTVYTGNYVFKAAGLRHFIPFADLKLRMAGPTLGRILRKRLKRRFVSANLPLLHKRTFQADYSNEFRSGISTTNNSIDLSLEFNRQFWGDVMLFSIEDLAELGYPDKRLERAEIAEIADAIQTKLWNLYREQQTEIAEKICTIENSLSCGKYWRDPAPAIEHTVQNLKSFCSLVNSNFGVNSASLEMISEQIREGFYINMIINAIHSFYKTDIAWSELLKSDLLAVTANCGAVDATIPGREADPASPHSCVLKSQQVLLPASDHGLS